jgi:two-component system, OmpR family, sensor kinase
MLRLFISLYLVIILGIAAINWASENIWLLLSSQQEHVLSQDILPIEQLAQALPFLIKNRQEFELLKQNSSLAINEIPVNDVAWLETQLVELNQGKSVVSYNQFNQAIVYIKSSFTDSFYQIGPIIKPKIDDKIKYFIMAFSYFILALIIAFWTRPIWRDLKRLSNMAEKIDDNSFTTIENIHSRSVISPIVNTINQMAKRIQKLISEQKQLINAVSHELRTPLSRLRFSLALIEDLDEKQLRDINQDINEVETLVEEMLGYSRIEHIAHQQEKSPVNISQLLNNQIEKLQRGCSKTLINNVNNHLTCLCNGNLIERATQNLITNAIQYASNNIFISAQINEKNLQIIIEDDGCGISKAQSLDLFKPFTRVDKSRSKQQGGFGLGLAIVQKVVDWHQGKCLIESSTHGGALFKILIPLD